ncbi:cation:proton antiporter subunit C [Eubacteriaceae bacterium ES3]|nr:cation:proton antiporter subunit C [Eubacteriaceae bacterium ES3]
MEHVNGENIAILLFFIGIYGMLARRNIIKSIISLGIMEVAIILYFISSTSPAGALPPIGDALDLSVVADPLPHALMITNIVIGIGVTAVALTMYIHLYHQFGTSNWIKVKRKRNKND